jgi:hypothetical protein
MVRKLITTLVIGGFAAFAAGAVSAAANDCTIAKGDGPVAKACAKGGIKEAKVTMKAMVAKAKKGGMKDINCDSCHKNEEDWKLTADGEKLMKDLLAKQ